jgi:hypothetical protein
MIERRFAERGIDYRTQGVEAAPETGKGRPQVQAATPTRARRERWRELNALRRAGHVRVECRGHPVILCDRQEGRMGCWRAFLAVPSGPDPRKSRQGGLHKAAAARPDAGLVSLFGSRRSGVTDKHRAIGAARRTPRGGSPALLGVPPIRAQKFRLDHIEDIGDQGVRR